MDSNYYRTISLFAVTALVSIAVSLITIVHGGVDTRVHNPSPREYAEEQDAQDTYDEEHAPDAGPPPARADAGPPVFYPDGGVNRTAYDEACRQICESPRYIMSTGLDHPRGEGVPHVIESNPEGRRCVCWRPDEYWGNHVENYYNWVRQFPHD